MSKSDPAAVYVIEGNDAFLRDEYRRRVLKTIVGDADRELSVSELDADAEPAEVFDELRTMPLLGGRRAVVVRDADSFITANADALQRYLESPSSSASLVLMVSSLDKRTRISKTLTSVAEVCDCTAPTSRRLGDWIRKAAEKRGKTIAPDAVELLTQSVGEDLGKMDSELEKLSVYVDSRETITADDVAAIVCSTTAAAPFALTNALTAGDTAGAVKALCGSMNVRGEEFRVLGQLAWHLRRALTWKQQMVTTGKCDFGKMPRQVANAYTNMLRRRTLSDLQQDFRRLIRADLAMKSGHAPRRVMQQLVVELCGWARKPAGAGRQR
ncbi:MAG: DNA polymerase III subunit delta [Phycisphaerae bacterium]